MNPEFFGFSEVQQLGYSVLFFGYDQSAKVHRCSNGGMAVGDLDGYTSEELGGTYYEVGTVADYMTEDSDDE